MNPPSQKTITSAFEKAYSAYLHRVEFFAYSFVGDREEAKSIAQEAFVKLWERRSEVDFTEDVLPLVIIITKNICLNWLRREKIKGKYESFAAQRSASFNIEVLDNPMATNVYEKEVQQLVKRAFDAMPEKVLHTYKLSREKDYKNREIADELGIGVSTVEFRLASAMRILRKYLKDYLHFILWFLPPIV